MTDLLPRDRGWTQRPDVAPILQRGVARFAAAYPWAGRYPGLDPERDLRFLLLTADDLRALHPRVSAAMDTRCGHNDGPSWEECVALAADGPDLLFAGFLMPPARADEGVDLDAVYVPQPDPGAQTFTRAITRPDGATRPPDENTLVEIAGRAYRRLWWD